MVTVTLGFFLLLQGKQRVEDLYLNHDCVHGVLNQLIEEFQKGSSLLKNSFMDEPKPL